MTVLGTLDMSLKLSKHEEAERLEVAQRRLLDLRHVRVAQFAAPTHDEKRHHFLWRFGPALPGWGGMAVLDRSWYGRVLVERVEGLATREQWERAYDEIA